MFKFWDKLRVMIRSVPEVSLLMTEISQIFTQKKLSSAYKGLNLENKSGHCTLQLILLTLADKHMRERERDVLLKCSFRYVSCSLMSKS